MQLEIIQIALGWWGEKYSLKVSDCMRSKLCDTVRQMHMLEWGFFSGFRGVGSFSISCHASLDWRGNPLFCFVLFFPFLVFLVIGKQLASMSPHDVNPCALQVGTEEPLAHEPAAAPRVGAKRCTCVTVTGSILCDRRSTCTVKSGNQRKKTTTNKRNLEEAAVKPVRCINSCVMERHFLQSKYICFCRLGESRIRGIALLGDLTSLWLCSTGNQSWFSDIFLGTRCVTLMQRLLPIRILLTTGVDYLINMQQKRHQSRWVDDGWHKRLNTWEKKKKSIFTEALCSRNNELLKKFSDVKGQKVFLLSESWDSKRGPSLLINHLKDKSSLLNQSEWRLFVSPSR